MSGKSRSSAAEVFHRAEQGSGEDFGKESAKHSFPKSSRFPAAASDGVPGPDYQLQKSIETEKGFSFGISSRDGAQAVDSSKKSPGPVYYPQPPSKGPHYSLKGRTKSQEERGGGKASPGPIYQLPSTNSSPMYSFGIKASSQERDDQSPGPVYHIEGSVGNEGPKFLFGSGQRSTLGAKNVDGPGPGAYESTEVCSS